MKRTIFLAFFLILLLAPSVAAQDAEFPRYTFLGQVRHRFEANDRDFNNDTDVITFNLLRSRFGVRFVPVENTEALTLRLQTARPAHVLATK